MQKNKNKKGEFCKKWRIIKYKIFIMEKWSIQIKKGKLLKNAFLIALIIWIVMLIKQQLNISQYQDEIKELSSKIDVAENELTQNKQDLEQEKKNTDSLEYIEKLAREKLGMYLQNERVYIDSNM